VLPGRHFDHKEVHGGASGKVAASFRRLQQYGVRLRRDQYSFLKKCVEYLGHKIDADGLQAIVNASAPRNVQELHSFLGLLNYYGKFIANLFINPLTSSTGRLDPSGSTWEITALMP